MADRDDVKVRIAGDNRGLDAALKNSHGIVNRFARQGGATLNRFAAGAIGGLVRNVFSLRGAIATLAGSGGIGLLIKSSLDAASNLVDTADKIGLGVEALQEWRFAAQLAAGVTQGTFDMALQRFSRRFGEAAQGSGELVKTLEQYGIATHDAEGNQRSLEDALADYADLIKNTESQQERLRLAFKGFDSEGAVLVNLFAKGAEGIEQLRQEARELGVVLDAVMVREAEAAGDQLERVGHILRTNLTRAVLSLTPQIVALGEAFAQKLGPFVEFLVTQLPDAVSSSDELRRRIAEVREEIAEIESHKGFTLFGIEAGSETRAQQVKELQAEVARLTVLLEERLRKEALVKNAIEGGGAANDVFSEKVRGVVEALEFERAQLGRTARAREIAIQLRKAETTIATEHGQKIAGLVAEIRRETQARQAQAEALKLAGEAAEQERADREAAGDRARALIREREEMMRSFEAELEQRVGLAEISTLNERDREIELRLLEEINRARATGLPLGDEEIAQRRERIALSVDQEQALKKESDTTRDAARELGLTFSSAFEDAIVEGGKLRDIIKGLGEDILRILTRKTVTEPFANAFSQLVGSAFGTFGGGAGVGAGLFRAGGRAEAPPARRLMPANAFAGAPRFARGTLPSLAPGEIPAILHRGEEVLNPAQSRALRAGMGGGPKVEVNVYAPPGATARQERDSLGDVDRVNIFIDEAVAGNLARQGSRTSRALTAVFGARAQVLER